jgi:ketol-acid reductoisomerase
LKLIVNLIYEGGLNYMRYSISEYRRIRRLHARSSRCHRANPRGNEEDPERDPVGQVRSRWLEENRTGRKKFLAMREAGKDQPIEKVGAELRAMMYFLKRRKEPAFRRKPPLAHNDKPKNTKGRTVDVMMRPFVLQNRS